MTQELAINPAPGCPAQVADLLTPMIGTAGVRAAWHLVDFFAVTIATPAAARHTTALSVGSRIVPTYGASADWMPS